MRILSLGAGVQSTTMALMAAHGEIERPDFAIFADTQWEPKAVYEHLTWLRSPNVLPFPVHVVTIGNIREAIATRQNTTGGRYAAVPWFTVNRDGSHGMGRRQCSSEYKLKPIMREVRRLLGVGPRDRIKTGAVTMLIGISRDEAHRMKPARQRYMVNNWPLIDANMTRQDCKDWLRRHDYLEPPKSACIGCPFHNDDQWLEMRDEVPEEWADAVAADAQLEPGEFMHSQRVRLDRVDFSKQDRSRTPDLFGQECEGMCGL